MQNLEWPSRGPPWRGVAAVDVAVNQSRGARTPARIGGGGGGGGGGERRRRRRRGNRRRSRRAGREPADREQDRPAA
jgi:hypothetical protein